MGTLPLFLLFQNFGKDRGNYRLKIPVTDNILKLPVDLLSSESPNLQETAPILRSEVTQKAWQIQGADETRRALRLLAAQISELFPNGEISTDTVFRSFSSKEFIQSTQATQLVAGDAVPVCQWLQTGYGSFMKKLTTHSRCKNKSIDLETETNQDCRFQAMIESCDSVPPLPFPSLYDSWRLCGQSSCDNQIAADLDTYLKFYKITGDSNWLTGRFVPMASQALKQTEGPFLLLPPMEFAKKILENPETAKIISGDGTTLQTKANEYIAAFDQAWNREFKDVNNLKSDLYRPTALNVSRFHALLKRAQIQRLTADPAAPESERVVRQFAVRLKEEVFTHKNLTLGYLPEVFEFIQDAAGNNIEFTAADVNTLKPTLQKHARSSPWRTQPRSFGLLLTTFVSE